MKTRYSVTQCASTLCAVLGVDAPKEASPAIEEVKQYLLSDFDKADRLLIYDQDATGQWIFEKYRSWFSEWDHYAPKQVEMQTVMPSVTPVCFASIYSGLYPEKHGIQAYAKPNLTCETFFDVVPRAGKKVALIAVADCSMASIFLQRYIDYFIRPTDEECIQTALHLIEKDEYDVIVCYNMDFDHIMHATTPESEEALAALKRHSEDFIRLCRKAEECWKQHNTVVCSLTDHGIHTAETKNGPRGTHGTDREEDLHIVHFYGKLPKSE